MHRRTFLKTGLATGVVGLSAAAGLLKPTEVLAAEWPKNAFGATKVEDAIKALFGSGAPQASAAVKIKAAPQAENAATVPITVSSDLPNIEAISVFVEKNDRPLVCSATTGTVHGYLHVRMKMRQTSDVHVVVKSGGKLYSAMQNIKVTVGGCGG
ncbi:MAG: thiosulfate oxidation carrier protein SoxY [Pseudomonadota bacterium]|nr:MAG: thiosulfate oxidation carrier protein SoxY [Pseudomonadota bacterium]